MSNAPKRKYDATIARIAGNILSNRVPQTSEERDQQMVDWAIKMAYLVVEAVEQAEIEHAQ